MTDDLGLLDLASKYGLGAIPDVPDPNDYPVEALYAAEGLTPAAVLPASYDTPNMPPVIDQDGTPRCVAYSSSTMKSWQDRKDQLKFFDFDEALFFRQIGGTAAGAYVRNAMNQMLGLGYPVMAVGDAVHHKIAAYYTIPQNTASLKAAIYDFGPIVVILPWYQSWFRPGSGGVLPKSDILVGYHAIVMSGWTTAGWRLINSWGADWGINGRCILPFAYTSYLSGAWKSVDVIEHPIPYSHVVDVTARPRLRIRSAPKTSAAKIGSLIYGRNIATLRLEKYGGKYDVNGRTRNDWLEVRHGTKRGWIARGFTKLIR